jgi:hypothetical protein
MIMTARQSSSRLKQTQEMLARLLALLEAGEETSSQRIFTNPVANTAALFERPNKGNKAVERTIIASYQIAQSLGLHGSSAEDS